MNHTRNLHHRILIVDDNPSIHSDFDKILLQDETTAGLAACETAFFGDSVTASASRPVFLVDHALDGESAVSMVQQAVNLESPYDMAFVDMRMPPGWDGLQTIEEAWKVDPDLHVAICTAYSDYTWEELHERISRPGQLLVLKKPFDTSEVAQLAAALSEKRELQQIATLQMNQLQGMVESRTRQLNDSRRESERFMEAISSIVIGIDEHGCISRWNNTSAQVFGVTASDVVGSPLAEIPVQWSNEDSVRQLTDTVHSHGPMRSELTFVDHSGAQRVLGTTTFPVADEGEQCGCLVLGTELTEKRVLQQQLRSAQKLEAVGQLAAGVAHEINTPMQYIGDNLDYLTNTFGQIEELIDWCLEHHDEDNPDSQPPISSRKLQGLKDNIPTALSDSAEGVSHVSRIVRAMKAFSHPGRETVMPVDINEALGNTITVARNEWKYVASVETDFDDCSRPVEGYVGELNQVFLNLIVNAAHAIEDSPHEQGTITVSTRYLTEHVEIRISDNGCGIPEPVQSRIFDPFFTTKEVGKGTGQGLAIAHNVVVQNHGGRLWFETAEDQGTTFCIVLPYEPAARDSSSTQPQNPATHQNVETSTTAAPQEQLTS